jgi:arylsulfatase A-like enzyme
MRAAAVQFLKDNREKPFFLYLPFIEPHVSMQPPRRVVETYPVEWDDRPYRGQCGYTPHPRPRAAYAAMITTLDGHVGAVLDTLDQLGLTDKTLVVFSSDNGATHLHGGDPTFGVGGADTRFFNSTAGLREYKGSVHEGGIRVPLIVRWPGLAKPGTVSDFPTYFADQFPTLCEAAGLKTPTGLDGVSLLPTLTGRTTSLDRNPLVWVFPEYGGQVAVRIGGMKAVRTNLNRPKMATGWQVYDLAKDPGESVDLAAHRPEVIEAAEKVLREQMAPNELFPVKVPGL